MAPSLLLSVIAIVGVVALVLSGWWRSALGLFSLGPRRMSVARLGLAISDPCDVQRVDAILSRFAGGFHAMLTTAREAAAWAFCDQQPPLLQPFAQEGLAMGYVPRRLLRFDPRLFERDVVKRRPHFRYLHYVGLGFWAGLRNYGPARLERLVNGLDPLYRYLCFDGYGFKVAFFDAPRDTRAMNKLELLAGYARHAAYQGAGRALWFRLMGRPDELWKQVLAAGAYAADAAAGVGLAAAFVNPDRLDLVRAFASEVPGPLQSHFHLGMCFALKARAIGDLEAFERATSSLGAAVRAAIHASIRECDRVELVVRAEAASDGYRRWRQCVTSWMDEHIEYPLSAVRRVASHPATHLEERAETPSCA